MEAVQLSLFEFPDYCPRTRSAVMYLNRVWWDNVVHAILSAFSFWLTLFAIVIATSTGISDTRKLQYVESILERRRRKAREQGKTVYLLGITVVNGQVISVIDTIKENMNTSNNTKDTALGKALAAGVKTPTPRQNLRNKRLKDIEVRFEMYTKPRVTNEALLDEVAFNFYKYNRK